MERPLPVIVRALPDFKARHPEPSCSGRSEYAALSHDLDTKSPVKKIASSNNCGVEVRQETLQ